MSKAVLTIAVDGAADARRAFGLIAGAAKKANDAIRRETAQTKQGVYRASQDETREALRAAASKIAAEQKVREAREQLAKQAGDVVARQVAMGVVAEENAAKVKEQVYRNLANAFIREEQRKTTAEKAELEKRKAENAAFARNELRRLGRGALSMGRSAFGAANSVAGDVFGQIGAVRQTFAGREHLINGALFQAGLTGGSAVAAQRRIRGFLTSAEGRGINGDELAAAINRGQTETSFLQAAGGRSSGQMLEDVLGNARLARDTYQDVGEVTRVGGILNNLGVRGGDNRAALLALTGIAQRGAIELSDVSSQALGPLVANINNAVNNATQGGQSITAEQRSGIVSHAAAQSLAVAEIGRGAGMSTTDSLNAYDKLSRGLQDPRSAEHLRTALHNRFNDRDFGRYDAELFESYRDARGHTRHRLRNTEALSSGQRLLEVFGNDSVALMSALKGGGHGAPQVFDRQVQRLFGRFAGTAEGQNGQAMTGFQRAQELAGYTLSEQRVAEGHAMTQDEYQTRITEQNEQHIKAIMENTEVLKVFETVMGYRAKNPIAAATAAHYGGALGEAAVAAAAGRSGSASHETAEIRAMGELPLAQRLLYGLQGRGGYASAHPAFAQRVAQIENQMRLAPGTTVELGPQTIAAMQHGQTDPALAAARAAATPNGAPGH